MHRLDRITRPLQVQLVVFSSFQTSLDILPSHAASHSAISASRLARFRPITRLHYTYLRYILPALKLKTTNASNYMDMKIQMQMHDQDYELTIIPLISIPILHGASKKGRPVMAVVSL
jgi:hypothetical protein